MIMLIEVQNVGEEPMALSAHAKANMKLGQGRPEPSDEERLRWDTASIGTKRDLAAARLSMRPSVSTTIGCGAVLVSAIS